MQIYEQTGNYTYNTGNDRFRNTLLCVKKAKGAGIELSLDIQRRFALAVHKHPRITKMPVIATEIFVIPQTGQWNQKVRSVHVTG